MRESQRQYSVEDYLSLEAGSPARHEYYDGAIFLMSGGTRAHARIALNVASALDEVLNDTPCEPYSSDMRLRTPSGLYTYPDVSVVCGEPELIGKEKETTLLNPTLIVEVLSDSTHGYDRGEKFELYRSITSLREYVLIEQTRASVEIRRRSAGNRWTTSVVASLDQSVHFASINVDLPLARIYRRVRFPR